MINLFTSILGEVLNSDEDEVIDMDLSSQQEPVFNTFSSSKRQSTTRSKQRVRVLSIDESKDIKQCLKYVRMVR
jgi:hypothetical protein